MVGAVDLIFDVVGGTTFESAVKALARGGRIAVTGYASGAPVNRWSGCPMSSCRRLARR
jgi:NADPH:quinone reductase-like Zn-dependent oxidoreductase